MNNKAITLSFVFLSLSFALTACGSYPSEQSMDRPAYIPEPSAESQQRITEAVAFLKQNTQVELGGRAFAESDTLIVHRAQLTGRDLGTPDHFRLVINNGECSLIHLGSGDRIELKELNCIPYQAETN